MPLRVVSSYWLTLLSLAACGAGGDYDPSGGDGAGGAASDAGSPGCLSSNECPTGYICNDFGRCEMPPPSGDGGVATAARDRVRARRADQLAALRLRRDDRAGRARAHRRPHARGDVDGRSARRRAWSRRSRTATARSCSTRPTAPPRSCGPTGDADTIRVLATLPQPQPARRRSDRPVRGDLVRSREGDSPTAASAASAASRTSPWSRSRPATRRRSNLTVGFRPREVAVRRRRQPRLRDHAGRRVGDRPRVRDDARAEHRAADPGRRSGDRRRVGRGRHRRRPASTRRCGSAGAPALRVVNVGATNPGAGVRRSRSRRRRPTSISRPTARGSTPSQRDGEAARDHRHPRRRARPERRRDASTSTNATIGSLVLSRDGTRAPAVHQRDARRAHHDGQARPARLPARDVAAQEGGARASASRRPAPPRSSSTPRRPAIRPARRSFDDFIDKSYGYTLLDLATGFAQAADHAGRSGPVRATRPTARRSYVALDGGDALDRDARAAGRRRRRPAS